MATSVALGGFLNNMPQTTYHKAEQDLSLRGLGKTSQPLLLKDLIRICTDSYVIGCGRSTPGLSHPPSKSIPACRPVVYEWACSILTQIEGLPPRSEELIANKDEIRVDADGYKPWHPSWEKPEIIRPALLNCQELPSNCCSLNH